MVAAPAESSGHRSGPSVGHLIAVCVLVGPSLAGLGWDLLIAADVAVPVWEFWAPVLMGTAAAVVLWAGGFRPALPEALGYFLSQIAVHAWLSVMTYTLLPVWPAAELYNAGLRAASIAVAGGLWFTPLGGVLADRCRSACRRVLKLPPTEESADRR